MTSLALIALALFTTFHISAPDIPEVSQAGSKAATETEELSSVIRSFYAACAKKDIEAIMRMGRQNNGLQDHRKSLEAQFASANLGFTDPVISRVEIDGNYAAAIVSVEAIETPVAAGPPRKSKLIRLFTFSKEAGVWRITDFVPAAQVVVQRVLDSDPKDRRQVLSGYSDLFTIEVCRNLLGRQAYFLARANYEEAYNLDSLIEYVAGALGDKSPAAYSNLALADAERDRPNQARALQLYQKSLSYFETINDPDGTAKALDGEARLYQSQGKYDLAFSDFDRALSLCKQQGNKRRQETILEDIAGAYFERLQYDAALDAYQKCIALNDELSDKAASRFALANMAAIFLAQRRYDQAIATYRQALVQFESTDEPDHAGLAHDGIAKAYFGSRDYDAALKEYEEALKLYQTADDKDGVATIFEAIANVYESRGQYQSAIEFLQKSLEQRNALKSRVAAAGLMVSIGNVYYSTHDYDTALQNYSRAMSEFEALDKPGGVLGALQNIGNAYFAQADYDSALDAYDKALKLSRKLSDQAAESNSLIGIGLARLAERDGDAAFDALDAALKIETELRNRPNIARVTFDIGLVFASQGNFSLALIQYSKALNLYQSLADKEGILTAYSNIAGVYVKLGAYKVALESSEKARLIAVETQNTAATARELGNIGQEYYLQGDANDALASFRQSIELWEKLSDESGLAASYTGLGNVLLGQGDYPQALDCYQKALAIQQKLANLEAQTFLLTGIANCLITQSEFAASLDYSAKAMALARRIDNHEFLWYAEYLQGTAQVGLKNLTEAQATYHAAISEIHTIRALGDTISDDQRAPVPRAAPYVAMADLLLQQSKPREALAFAEQGKSQLLIDVLRSSGASITKGLMPQEKETEGRLARTALSFDAQLHREKLLAAPKEQKLDTLTAKLAAARSAYNSFETSLYKTHPELAAYRALPSTTGSETLKSAIATDDKTLVLEYLLTRDRSYLFAITKSTGPNSQSKIEAQSSAGLSISVFQIPTTQKDVAERVLQFRRMIINQDPNVESTARALFETLLGPAAALLEGKNTLVIIPDGMLWALPFAALQPGPGRYLIEDSGVAYALSLSAARMMELSPKAKAQSAASDSNITVFQQAAVSPETTSLVQMVYPDYSADTVVSPKTPVPSTAKDTRSQLRTLAGPDVTSAALKTIAHDFGILQFDTGAIIDDRLPMRSVIPMAQSDHNDPQSGLVTAAQIADANLDSSCVILSQSQRPDYTLREGEGIQALAWAFFVAGVRQTILTQWRTANPGSSQINPSSSQINPANSQINPASSQVNPASSHINPANSQMVSEIDAILQSPPGAHEAPPSAAEAIRHAMLKLLGSNEHKHPYYWSGFMTLAQ